MHAAGKLLPTPRSCTTRCRTDRPRDLSNVAAHPAPARSRTAPGPPDSSTTRRDGRIVGGPPSEAGAGSGADGLGPAGRERRIPDASARAPDQWNRRAPVNGFVEQDEGVCRRPRERKPAPLPGRSDAPTHHGPALIGLRTQQPYLAPVFRLSARVDPAFPRRDALRGRQLGVDGGRRERPPLNGCWRNPSCGGTSKGGPRRRRRDRVARSARRARRCRAAWYRLIQCRRARLRIPSTPTRPSSDRRTRSARCRIVGALLLSTLLQQRFQRVRAMSLSVARENPARLAARGTTSRSRPRVRRFASRWSSN